jgi:hypothetical protein
MEHEIDRDDYGLRVLIETMQVQGRSEREITAAVCEASGAKRHIPSPSRHVVRFGLPRRLARGASGSDRS